MNLVTGMIAAVVVVTAGGAQAELVRTKQLPARTTASSATSASPGALVVGNVKVILDGQSTGSNVLRVKPGLFTAALGAGSLTPDPAGQGETFVLGRHSFVKSVDPETGYETTSSVGGIWTGFVAGLPRGARPVARYEVRGEVKSFEDIYAELAKVHGPLFAVIGKASFEQLEVSAVKKAPCFGESIVGEKKNDYFHKPAVLRDVEALTFGLVLRSAADATSGTARIFYINPDDRGSAAVQSHTHFAQLRPDSEVDVSHPEKSIPAISAVAHLLTQSRVRSADLEVYELSGVTSSEDGQGEKQL